MRPFDEKGDNLIEIINEIILITLILFLLIINKESKWTNKAID